MFANSVVKSLQTGVTCTGTERVCTSVLCTRAPTVANSSIVEKTSSGITRCTALCPARLRIATDGTHTNVDAFRRGLICVYCGKSFTHPSNLYRHKKSLHENVRRYKCDACGSNFNRRDNLTQHIAYKCRSLLQAAIFKTDK